MKPSQVLLEPPERSGHRDRPGGLERGLEIGELAQASYADPQTMQSVRRGPATGPAVGARDLRMEIGTMTRKESLEAERAARGGGPGGGDLALELVEEAAVPSGAERGPQELAADAGVVAQPGAEPREALAVLGALRRVRDLREEIDRHVAIAHLADEPREVAEPAIEGGPAGLLRDRERFAPEPKADPHPPQIAVQSVQGRRSRGGTVEDAIGPAADLGQEPAELVSEPADGNVVGSETDGHAPSPGGARSGSLGVRDAVGRPRRSRAYRADWD